MIFIGINLLLENNLPIINRIKIIHKEKSHHIIVLASESKLDLLKAIDQTYLHSSSPLNTNEVNKLLSLLKEEKNKRSPGMVLVLDDDYFILTIVSKILEKEDIHHLTYSKVYTLVDEYKKKFKETSVIVLDANLKDISGYEVTTLIRRFEESNGYHKVPIICISGDTDTSHFLRCKEVGVTETCKFYIVTKPVKREDYIDAINKYLF